MVKVMAITSGSGSWFGFQVRFGFGVAVAVLADVQGVPKIGSGGREVLLDPVAGADDDRVLRGPVGVARAGVLGLLDALTRGGQVFVVGHAPRLFCWSADRVKAGA